MARMHVDELAIDEPLVRRLVAEQFPEWANLQLARVEPAGTDNAIFRLGDMLAVRLPRIDGPPQPGGREQTWLPRLAPYLPLETHVPVAQGTPGAGYPWYWDVYTWVDGSSVGMDAIDAVQAAGDLAGLVAALQRIDPSGAPPGRGVTLGDDPALTEEWESALAVSPWEGPPVWHHGDLDVRNWLVRSGRIAAVIDWSCMGVGDPAVDVMVAWKLHSPEARAAFRDALPTDDATWRRARGWALSQAIGALAYYTPESNAVLYGEAESWLEQVLLDRE